MLNINIRTMIGRIPGVKRVRALIFENKFKKKVSRLRKGEEKCIFFMATPCHGNLGDQAIVYAQYKFMDKIGVKDTIIEIKNTDYLRYKSVFPKYITEQDTIIIDGGGNLGTLWPNEDDKISEIISTYNKNKIVVFPQTCYYDETPEANLRLVKNKEIYNKAKKITIALRDEKSYKFFDKHFDKVNKIYVPDIVLSISDLRFEYAREGCLLCFREDLEKKISDKDIKKLKLYLDHEKVNYKETSTIIEQNVNKEMRNKVLMEKWKEFSKAKLIITDRLHGMIFAAITGTPCLALDNSSKKVSGVYEWIKDHKYIKVCSDIDEVKESVSEILEFKKNNYKGSELTEFKELIKVVKD